MKLTIAILSVAGVAAGAQAGVVFAGTSFENAFAGAQYVDLGDASVDHDLVNNAGQSDVNFLNDGVEIGYNSQYFNTRDDVGLTDGDFVGATNFTGTVGAFTDGVQGFQMQDADGLMRTSFDTVMNPGALFNSRVETEWSVCIDFFIQSTGWEADDRIRIWVESTGVEMDILNTMGADIDDLDIEDRWITAELDLTGFDDATLHVELDSNSGSESLYLDNIAFKAVPTPGALSLLGLGGLAATRRRR
jgi:hypothetical protein